MKVKQVKTSFSATVNLGNYNSVKIEAGLEIDVGSKEDFLELLEVANNECKQFVVGKVKQVKEKQVKEKQQKEKQVKGDSK